MLEPHSVKVFVNRKIRLKGGKDKACVSVVPTELHHVGRDLKNVLISEHFTNSTPGLEMGLPEEGS